MLTSFSVFQSALEKYQQFRKKKEQYSNWESAAGGLSAGFATGFLVVAIIFVALELLVMFFAINVAFRCTQGGAERIVHLVLAVVFTLPYMLLSLLFNKCAVDVIRGNYVTPGSTNLVAEPVKMAFGANKIV